MSVYVDVPAPLEDGPGASQRYRSRGGLVVHREARVVAPGTWNDFLATLDSEPGGIFEGTTSYPGRYAPWRCGFADPYLVYEADAEDFRISALRADATPLLRFVHRVLDEAPVIHELTWLPDGTGLRGRVTPTTADLTEEERTRRPTAVDPLRLIAAAFASDEDHHLGWCGAFGYELLLQWEPVTLRLPRAAGVRTVVVYLPGRLLCTDEGSSELVERRYRFEWSDPHPERDLRRADRDFLHLRAASLCESARDGDPEAYREGVRRATRSFLRGDLFEVVLSQTISRTVRHRPSEVYRRLTSANPSPYQFFLNLGRGEALVGASPEMFVRVRGSRVETCPISGTIARGQDAIQDAEHIRTLLDSEKDEAELTMCTDVDRNDKSRVCLPGSVEVIGRRQIEMYSRLIHTVDHVQGVLRPDCDAWDAFLSHMWAVTVTGAPKRAATQFIEDHEPSARRWYGGAVGLALFDGTLNTGLTLRAARICDGVAEVRVGATLLVGSDPVLEERETRLKGSAVLAALTDAPVPARPPEEPDSRDDSAPRVLVVDHEDSFVNTLADYFRQASCETTTRRWGFSPAFLDHADIAVLSPGPGRPDDFGMAEVIARCDRGHIPLFGVCLGLQGVVEYFGGTLSRLSPPVHGRASRVGVLAPDDPLFSGIPPYFSAGRYHSLHVRRGDVPDCLQVTAETGDGVVMAVRHRTLPIVAVQFHPESVMTLHGGLGRRLVRNVVDEFCRTG